MDADVSETKISLPETLRLDIGKGRILTLMPVSDLSHDSAEFNNGSFRTTQWSVVLAAGGPEEDGSAQAMEELCRRYWFPIYAFIRRQGHPVADAQDLTQGFFAHILEREMIASARQEKGRFRSFMLGALKNFLRYEVRKQSTLKRGGGTAMIPMAEDLEERYQREFADGATPETLYLRSWVHSLMSSALDQLRSEFDRAGKPALFQKLSPFLSGASEETSHRELASLLGISVGAVTTSIYRMRQRYGELLRSQIAATVTGPEEVEDEITFLFSVIER